MLYHLPLAEEKVKPHQVTTLHLVSALSFIGTGAIIVVYNYTIPGWGVALLLLGLLVLGFTIFRNKWLTSHKVNPVFRALELLVTASFGIYAYTQHWKFPIVIFGILSAGLAFSLYWERRSGNQLFIEVDDAGLTLPVVRRRFIPWHEVEQIVYRFGTLTINCVDNHFFQWNIQQSDVDDEIFDAYCTARVEENIDKRRKGDW